MLDAAAPVRLEIPSIGVSTDLVALGLNPDGTMQVPTKWEEAGWYARGPRPGEDGPAVIAGHVDSTSGPAVFFRLHDLRAGDEVLVTRADHSVVRFVIDRLQQFPKASFPTAAVFGATPGPTLRLITCTGAFDETARSYLDNLVAFASPRLRLFGSRFRFRRRRAGSPGLRGFPRRLPRGRGRRPQEWVDLHRC